MITESNINNLLEGHTAILVRGIIESMSVRPQAIYLVGGYGRGEGAWYEDETGIHPYNDFDIAVISDATISHDKIEELRKELAKAVGIKWVDIDFYSLNGLKNMLPTIHNVDLFEGNSLLFGDDVIKENNLHLDSSVIGREDLITLFWTRMWTFLGSWTGDFHNLNVEEARFFKNQMAKAVLAACDMQLVGIRKYTTSYRKRAEIIMKERADDKSICELVQWAINEKLRPSCEEMEDSAMRILYFRVKAMFVESFEKAFGQEACFFLNPYKTKSYYVWHTKNYLYHIYSLIRNHSSRIARRLDVYYAMNYVFHANNDGIVDEKMIDEASRLLRKRGFIKNKSYTWDSLRPIAAEARNNV